MKIKMAVSQEDKAGSTCHGNEGPGDGATGSGASWGSAGKGSMALAVLPRSFLADAGHMAITDGVKGASPNHASYVQLWAAQPSFVTNKKKERCLTL